MLLCAPMIVAGADSEPAALAAGIFGGGVSIGPWLVRQTILSGYPLYPIEALALPVDWKVPYEKGAVAASDISGLGAVDEVRRQRAAAMGG